MYPEFIAIYILLAIVILMLGAVLFLLFKLLKEGISTNNSSSYVASQQPSEPYYAQQYAAQGQYQQSYPQQTYQGQYQPQTGSVVFCKQCATQFDASQPYCPNCGTRR